MPGATVIEAQRRLDGCSQVATTECLRGENSTTPGFEFLLEGLEHARAPLAGRYEGDGSAPTFAEGAAGDGARFLLG